MLTIYSEFEWHAFINEKSAQLSAWFDIKDRPKVKLDITIFNGKEIIIQNWLSRFNYDIIAVWQWEKAAKELDDEHLSRIHTLAIERAHENTSTGFFKKKETEEEFNTRVNEIEKGFLHFAKESTQTMSFYFLNQEDANSFELWTLPLIQKEKENA